jgi:hypothetical protein
MRAASKLHRQQFNIYGLMPAVGAHVEFLKVTAAARIADRHAGLVHRNGDWNVRIGDAAAGSHELLELRAVAAR